MNLWDEILARIETKVNRHSFYTWFRPTTFVAEDRTSVTVRVPNALFKDWLTKHYAGGHHRSHCRAAAAAIWSSPSSPSPRPMRRSFRSSADEAAALETGPAPSTQPGPAGLNPRYTFDTFIVGSSNQFAHAACRAVAEAPSRSYNPLFIYGGVGLGKTHLMHAVGHYVLQHDRNLKLTYISSERFMNEMINAVRYDRVLDFRERYRIGRRAAGRRHPVSRRQRRARRPSSSTPSTRSTTRRSRSSSAATARRTRFRRSKSGCDRGSSGG